MSQIQIYDRPMCCSTGVCGPAVDPVLPRFAGDLDWLSQQGHVVNRFNLAQQPAAFTSNNTVQQLLQEHGTECLPLVFVDGRLLSRGEYPSRQNLALWTNTETPVSDRSLGASPLPVLEEGCSGQSGCC